MEENEENRGLNDEKSYEDQFTTFSQFCLGTLSIISFSHTLAHLDFSWSTF